MWIFLETFFQLFPFLRSSFTRPYTLYNLPPTPIHYANSRKTIKRMAGTSPPILLWWWWWGYLHIGIDCQSCFSAAALNASVSLCALSVCSVCACVCCHWFFFSLLNRPPLFSERHAHNIFLSGTLSSGRIDVWVYPFDFWRFAWGVDLVPPFWSVEPRDVSVLAGQPLIVHCQADGYPKPNVTWSWTSGNTKSNQNQKKRKRRSGKFDWNVGYYQQEEVPVRRLIKSRRRWLHLLLIR